MDFGIRTEVAVIMSVLFSLVVLHAAAGVGVAAFGGALVVVGGLDADRVAGEGLVTLGVLCHFEFGDEELTCVRIVVGVKGEWRMKGLRCCGNRWVLWMLLSS